MITAVWLRLLPAPAAFLPVASFYADTETGCAAIERVPRKRRSCRSPRVSRRRNTRRRRPIIPWRRAGRSGFWSSRKPTVPWPRPGDRGAEGRRASEGSLGIVTPESTAAVEELWRWRDGVSIAVSAQLGGKVSEDIVVPLDRLAEAVAETVAIGERHALAACSWGHAGDGNLHATFLVDPGDEETIQRAETAAGELFSRRSPRRLRLGRARDRL